MDKETKKQEIMRVSGDQWSLTSEVNNRYGQRD